MPRNDENGDSSSLSEPTSLGAVSLSQSVDLAARNSDLEGRDSDCLADKDPTSPPLGVKLTGYKLLFMTTIFSFGTVKGILTYMGQSIAPNTLDWVSGTLLAVVLYWIGLYDERDSNKWRWFFQVDLSPAIGHCAKRIAGRAMWPLLFLGSALRIVLRNILLFFQVDFAPAMGYFAKRVVGGFIRLLLCLDDWYTGVFLGVLPTGYGFCIQVTYFPHAPLGPPHAVYFAVGFCVWVLRTRRVRVLGWNWEWKPAMGFVNDYGPGARHAEQYGSLGKCFGVLGTFVGFFCVVAFLLLPFVVILFCFHLASLLM